MRNASQKRLERKASRSTNEEFIRSTNSPAINAGTKYLQKASSRLVRSVMEVTRLAVASATKDLNKICQMVVLICFVNTFTINEGFK